MICQILYSDSFGIAAGKGLLMQNFNRYDLIECYDTGCAVIPSQCRISTSVRRFLLAIVVVVAEHYCVGISAGVLAFFGAGVRHSLLALS